MKRETRVQWGQAIKAQREFLGITQSALAEAVGVHQTAVSAWECGKAAPDVELHHVIAGALRADPGVLFRYPAPVGQVAS